VLAITSVLADNPIVISKGGYYQGCYSSDNPNVPAITIQTTAAVTIGKSSIVSAGDAIQINTNNINLTVWNCYAVEKPERER
jgi:hypothetical protein